MKGRSLAVVGRNLLAVETAVNGDDVSSWRQAVQAIDAAIIGPALSAAVLPPHRIAFGVARHHREDLSADHRFAIGGRPPAPDHSPTDHPDHAGVARAGIVSFPSPHGAAVGAP